MSDLVHFLEEFKNDEGAAQGMGANLKLSALKEDKKKIEARCVEMESRATELAKNNSDYLAQVLTNYYLVLTVCICM